MPQHYIITYGSHRPFVEPAYPTCAAYAQKRFRDATTPIAISYNLLLPFLNDFNGRLEGHIKDNANGRDDADEDLAADARQSGKIATIKFAEFAARTAVQTGIMGLLLSDGRPLAKASAHAFDMYQGMHYEYYSRLLNAMYLPKRWALVLGAMPKEGEVAFFEHRPLSVSAAVEDVAKRHTVMLLTDATVGTTFAIVHEQLLVAEEKRRPTGAVALGYLRGVAFRYAGAMVGAVVGSRFSGAGEYWGEMVGAMVATSLNASMLAAARKKRHAVAE